MSSTPLPIHGSNSHASASRPGSWAKGDFSGPSSGGWTMEGVSSVGSWGGGVGGAGMSFTAQNSLGNGFAPSGSWRGEGWRGLPVPPSSPSNLNPILSTSMSFSSGPSPFNPGSYLPSSPAYSSRDLSMSVDSDSSLPSRAQQDLGTMYAQHGAVFNPPGQPGKGPGSFGVNSFTGPGSVERLSQLEQNFTSNFNCCGLQLKGLHDLLNHYEAAHVLKDSSALFQKQAVPRNLPSASLPAASQLSLSTPPQSYPIPHLSHQSTPSPTTDSDAPHTPGMMDLEMDDAPLPSPFPSVSYPLLASLPTRISSSAPSPWSSSSALVAQAETLPPRCFPPSLLTYTLPARAVSPAASPTPPVLDVGVLVPARKASSVPAKPLSPGAEEKKAKKKREKKERADGEEADGEGGAGEKRFYCPVEGCGKIYKQQNGLKYHLQRSINSSHGHLAGTVTPQGILIPAPMVAT